MGKIFSFLVLKVSDQNDKETWLWISKSASGLAKTCFLDSTQNIHERIQAQGRSSSDKLVLDVLPTEKQKAEHYGSPRRYSEQTSPQRQLKVKVLAGGVFLRLTLLNFSQTKAEQNGKTAYTDTNKGTRDANAC